MNLQFGDKVVFDTNLSWPPLYSGVFTIDGRSGVGSQFGMVRLREIPSIEWYEWRFKPHVAVGTGRDDGISSHVQRHPTIPGAWVHA